MGTGRIGVYKAYRDVRGAISRFAVVHADEGDFTVDPHSGRLLRLKDGGHGQRNIELMDKYGIAYVIDKIGRNGVRYGHVPNHKNRLKQRGHGQLWFPKSWSASDIERAGRRVFADVVRYTGYKDGLYVKKIRAVRVGILIRHGAVHSIFPAYDQEGV